MTPGRQQKQELATEFTEFTEFTEEKKKEGNETSPLGFVVMIFFSVNSVISVANSSLCSLCLCSRSASILQPEQLAQGVQQGVAGGVVLVRLFRQRRNGTMKDLVLQQPHCSLDRLAVGLLQLAVEPGEELLQDRLALGLDLLRQPGDYRAVATAGPVPEEPC